MRGRRCNRGEQGPQQRTHIPWLPRCARRERPGTYATAKQCPAPAGTRGTRSPTLGCCMRVGDRWRTISIPTNSRHTSLATSPGYEDLKYYSGKNDYLPVFCFEGLITEFVEITYRFPSLRASFSSQEKTILIHFLI